MDPQFPPRIIEALDRNDAYGDWYFRGSTFEKNSAGNLIPKDPLNFIFYGASADQTPYTRERIETHINDDWDTRAVGGSPWRKDDEMRFYCKENQIARWRNLPGETGDLSDWHGSTAGKSATICGKQHHARFWDDKEHADATDHGARHQWVVGGVHHEKVVYKFPCCASHKVDRDWDRVRVEFVKGLRKHCSYRRWKYHPGADQTFQDYTNFGFIARISLRHVASGCDGS